MHPQPNESGIYTDWTEHLRYDDCGIRTEVMLVQCADGWRWGYGYWTDARVSCSLPNVDRCAHATKQDALGEARMFLQALTDDEVERLNPPPATPATHPQLELF